MSRKRPPGAEEGEGTATLLFDLAHDMRSPLLTLLGFAELALDKPEPSIFVMSLDDSWYRVAVRPWARTPDW